MENKLIQQENMLKEIIKNRHVTLAIRFIGEQMLQEANDTQSITMKDEEIRRNNIRIANNIIKFADNLYK